VLGKLLYGRLDVGFNKTLQGLFFGAAGGTPRFTRTKALVEVKILDLPEIDLAWSPRLLAVPVDVGVGEDEYFVASDAAPIIDYTRNVMYLDEGEMAIISNGELTIKNIFENEIISKEVSKVDWSIDQIEKKAEPLLKPPPNST